MKIYFPLRGTFMCLALLALLLAGFPRAASAGYMSGTDFVTKCLSEKKEDVYGCVHYVAGVIDYHMVIQSLGTAPPTLAFCIPPSISMTQAAFLVLTYLRTEPQNEGFVAAMAVPMALNKAFPCKAATQAKKKK